jgi:hypothetical protein
MVRLTARWRALTRSLWPSAVLGQPQSRPVRGALRHTGFGPHTRDASRLVLEHLVDRYRCFPFSVIVHHRAKMSWQSDQTAGQPKDTGVRSWSKIDSYTLWHAVAKLEADKRARAIVRLRRLGLQLPQVVLCRSTICLGSCAILPPTISAVMPWLWPPRLTCTLDLLLSTRS